MTYHPGAVDNYGAAVDNSTSAVDTSAVMQQALRALAHVGNEIGRRLLYAGCPSATLVAANHAHARQRKAVSNDA